MTEVHRACVGLGANLGDARASLEHALHALDTLPRSRVRAISSLYRSAPVDAEGPDFLNAVAMLDTCLDEHALLSAMQAVELAAGRERSHRNAPRTLDLDLLLYDIAADGIESRKIETPVLQVPHPRLHARAFVLAPLCELAPELRIAGRAPLPALLAACRDQVVERIAPARGLGWCDPTPCEPPPGQPRPASATQRAPIPAANFIFRS